MPKILKQEDDFTEEDTDVDDLEEDQPIERGRGRPPIKQPIRPIKRSAPIELKRRFGIVAPQTIKIVDTETNEVIGEGDFAVVQALTDILERLERIETQIGAVLSS